jgi:Zn-dependent protease
LTQLAFWALLSWRAGRNDPGRSARERVAIGGASMLVLLGSEWCHNLAHAAAAWHIRKPMDVIRITWGMPLVVYYDLHDPRVKPREHIVRALGGPVFNALTLPVWGLLKRRMKNPACQEVLAVGFWMNVFLSTVSLLPLPGIDGGPILKWSLIERGRSPEQADLIVRKTDAALSGVLAFVAGWLWRRRRRGLAAALLGTAGVSAAFALGMLHEE